MDKAPKTFIFIGRSGSGKGTQLELLKRLYESQGETVLDYQSGGMLREFTKAPTGFVDTIAKQTMDTGGIFPSFLPIYFWSKFLVERFTGKEFLMFEGAPRMRTEAEILEGALGFLPISKPYVIYLHLSEAEATNRLLGRGRFDDHDSAIKTRQGWFTTDVVPVIEYFRTSPRVHFLEINGEQSVEAIHADIVSKL